MRPPTSTSLLSNERIVVTQAPKVHSTHSNFFHNTHSTAYALERANDVSQTTHIAPLYALANQSSSQKAKLQTTPLSSSTPLHPPPHNAFPIAPGSLTNSQPNTLSTNHSTKLNSMHIHHTSVQILSTTSKTTCISQVQNVLTVVFYLAILLSERLLHSDDRRT